MKRWQRILIIVCVLWLVGGITTVMLLRDTREFSSGEVKYMVGLRLRAVNYYYTTLHTKYVGDGIWELRTKIGKSSGGWHPVVITFDEKKGRVTHIERKEGEAEEKTKGATGEIPPELKGLLDELNKLGK